MYRTFTNKPDVYHNLIRIYGECQSDNWCDIEKSLFNFNLDNYPYNVVRSDIREQKCGLNDALWEWARTIGSPKRETIIDNIDKSTLFFTFNYTRTLENLYGIDERPNFRER